MGGLVSVLQQTKCLLFIILYSMNYDCLFKISFEWYRQYLAQASWQAADEGSIYWGSGINITADKMSVIYYFVFYEL